MSVESMRMVRNEFVPDEILQFTTKQCRREKTGVTSDGMIEIFEAETNVEER